MSLLTEISLWLKENDLYIKAIATIAAPGGIWFWIDKFRNRIRVKVRRLSLPPYSTSPCGITFEAENVSSNLTSFEPNFTMTGYSSERKKQTYTFRITDDRQLPSHLPKGFFGWDDDAQKDSLLFLWFMTFQLPLSRGKRVSVRVRNVEFKQLSFFRFHWERLLFLWFGKVPE